MNPDGTLRGRLREQQRRRFVGRAAETDAFIQHAIRARPPTFHVFSYAGVGGIGKTALLTELANLAKLNSPNVAVATLETAHSAFDLMSVWRSQLNSDPKVFRTFDKELRRYSAVASKLHAAAGSAANGAYKALENSGIVGAFIAGTIGEERLRGYLSQFLNGRESNAYLEGPALLTSAFIAGVNKLSRSGRLFLMIDYYEGATAEVDDWVRRCLESDLSTETVLVLAGRERPERMNSGWSAFRPFTLVHELKPFTEQEQDEYLDRLAVQQPSLRADLKAFTGGLPWALALSVEGIDVGGTDPVRPQDFHEVRSMVVNRFLSQLEQQGRLREVVEACCILEAFDLDALAALLDASAVDELEQLSRYSFVVRRDDGRWVIKEVVREAVIEILRQRSPLQLLELRRRAAWHYQQLVDGTQLFSVQWQDRFVEWIRHTIRYDVERAVDILVQAVSRVPAQVWRIPSAGAFSLITAHPEASQDPRIRYLDGESARAAGNLAIARERFRSIAADPGAADTLQISALASLIEIMHQIGDVGAALASASDGYQRATTAALTDHATMFAARLAEMHGVLGDQRTSDHYCAIAMDGLPSITDHLVAGQAALVLCYMLAFAGRHSDASAVIEVAIRRWRAVGYDFGVAQAESCAAWHGWLTGRIAAGLAAGNRAYRYFESINDHYYAGLASLNLGELYRQAGSAAESLDWLDRARVLLSANDGFVYLAITLYRLGRVNLALGQDQQAVAWLEEAVALERDRVHEPYSLGMALLYLAEGYHRVGSARAGAVLSEAVQVLIGAQNRHGRVLAKLVGATLGAEIGAERNPEPLIHEALAAASAAGFHDLESSAHLALARMAAGTDDEATGSHLGLALAAAAKFSPYLGDATLRSCQDVLSALPNGRREEVARRMAQVFASAPHAVSVDRLRRAEEAALLNTAPLIDQMVTVI
ncbi:tetratricopeptide repeat protein [Dactylosporangium sp. NPDC050688]|uniref:tetratricopeptide repeat protein n=1 Tax=Dactylosporangium sp. NPDC050688 TaxID=3157217 RepID=UPI0033F2B98E